MEKEGLLEADTILPKCSTSSMVLHSGGKIKKFGPHWECNFFQLSQDSGCLVFFFSVDTI